MAKNNKGSSSPQKTKDSKEISKDIKKKVKKKRVDDMEHKRGIKTKGLQKRSFNQMLQGIGDTFKSIRKIMINLIILILVLVLIIIICRELKTNFVLIEPFEVPQEFEKKGYTGRAITNKLIDQINLIRITGKTSKDIMSIMPIWSNKELKIELPGTGISLNSILQYIKRFFGREQIRIVGEIVIYNKLMYATIRVSGKPAKTFSGELENLDKILYQAAEHIFKYTRPYILASYLHKIDKKDACLETIQHILSNEPFDDDDYAYILWGIVLHEKGDLEDAIAKYQEAIELNPKEAYAYLNWGVVLFDQGEYDSSISMYMKAIKFGMKDAIVYDNLGTSWARKSEITRAIKYCKRAIELDPKYARAYTHFGAYLHMQGDYEDSIDKFQKSIELDPEYAGPYFGWAQVLEMQENYNDAIAKYQKAIELDPEGKFGKMASYSIENIIEKIKKK